MMAKLQDYDHNIFCVMDLELEKLFYKIFRAICSEDMELEYVPHLLKSRRENANSWEVRVNNSIKKIDSQLENLKLAHKEYMEKMIENAIGNKEEMNFMIGKCDDYLRVAVNQVQEVLRLYSNLKF